MSWLAEQISCWAHTPRARSRRWQLLAIDRRDDLVEIASAAVDAVRSAQELSACLHVEVNGRVGAATTSRLDDLDRLLAEAETLAPFGPVTDQADWTTSGIQHNSRVLAAPVGDLGSDPRAEPLESATDALRRLQEDTRLLIHGTVDHVDQTVHFASPAGTHTHRDVFWAITGVAEGRDDPGLQLPWSVWTRRPQLPGYLPAWLSLAQGWQNLPQVQLPNCPVDLVLAPPAVHTLLTPLVSSLSGASVLSGRSLLSERLTQPWLDPRLSLVDGCAGERQAVAEGADGLVRPAFDDEGAPCQELRLISDGVPVRLYHSRSTAAVAQTASTGHGFRGNALHRKPAQPVTPVLNHAVLQVRGADLTRGIAELVSAIDHGVLVESLLGAQQKGRLSPIVEGRIRLGVLIRRGRVVGRIGDQPVALDLREILGARFAGVTEEAWAVSRLWSGRLPFVVASGVGPARGSGCTT